MAEVAAPMVVIRRLADGTRMAFSYETGRADRLP